MYDYQAMAYWHNLSWVIADRYTRAEGGLIENMEALAFDIEVAKVTVKTKKTAEVSRDIYGKIITKGKKGKETIQQQKPQYLEPTFKQQQITCQTLYQVATGTTDILGKIEEIKGMMGSVSPLVVGCVVRDYSAKYDESGDYPITSYPRVLGVYNMQLMKIKVSDLELDSAGRALKAKVSFTFSEATDQKAIKACMAYPGDATRLMLSGWIDKVSEYTEVEDPAGNPAAQGWYELNPKYEKNPAKQAKYILTKDKKVVEGKNYYEAGKIPESYWSALKVAADPTAKALVKQKAKDDKALAKAKTADMKARIKAAQKEIRAGTYVDDGTL